MKIANTNIYMGRFKIINTYSGSCEFSQRIFFKYETVTKSLTSLYWSVINGKRKFFNYVYIMNFDK